MGTPHVKFSHPVSIRRMTNPVPKILSVVALLLSLAAGAESFMAKSNLQAARSEAATAKEGIASIMADRDKALNESKTLKDKLTTATAAKEAAEAQVNSAKETADKATADLKTATDKLSATETQLASAVAEKAALPAATPAVDPELEKKLKDAQAALEEKKQIEASLTAKNNDLTVQVKALQDADALRQRMANKPGLQGTVLAVNPGWNFVVLNLGDKQGVAANSTLLIKRGSAMVAKVRVTTVEPSVSIADVVPGSADKKFHVQPGDLVIYSGI